MINKQILRDYIDVCELIKETELDISRMRKIEIEHAKVTGSNPDFPYQKMSFHVSGTTETYLDAESVKREKKLLMKQKQQAEELKHEIEKWMNTIPARMQRIIRMKYFEEKTWEEVATNIGRNATADSVRKEFNRFMRKK